MKTAITASLHADHPGTDLTDLVFENRNREYGAFTLRKSYSKFLTTAAAFACMLFILGLSSPLILSYVKGVVVTDPGTVIDTRKIIDINPVKTEQPPDKLVVAPPEKVLTNTQEYHAPAIVPDNEVRETYTPPVIDDKTQIGRDTHTGDLTGDITDIGLPPADSKGGAYAPPAPPLDKPIEFFKLEETPHFPGGDDQLMSYFASSIKYPPIALRAGVQGKVYIQFVLTREGKVTNATVAKGIGGGCDEEALRVVQAMPTWTPGKQNGRAVSVYMSMPITFKLKE